MTAIEKQKKYHTFDSISEGEADYNHSKWVGSVFYYFLSFGSRPFKHFTQKKYGRRNLWTGYFLKLTLLALALFAFLRFFGN